MKTIFTNPVKVGFLNRGNFTTYNPPKIKPMKIDNTYKNTTPNADHPKTTVTKKINTGNFALHGIKVKNLTKPPVSRHETLPFMAQTPTVVHPNPNINPPSSNKDTTVNMITTTGKNDKSVIKTGNNPSNNSPVRKSNTIYCYAGYTFKKTHVS